MEFETIKMIGIIIGMLSPIIAWVWRTSLRVSRLEVRQDALFETLKNLPGSKEFHELQLGIEKLNGSMKELSAYQKTANGRMDKVEQSVERVESYLLNQGNNQ